MARETWPFECPRCLVIWEEEYTVRHLTDRHGNEVDVWLRDRLQVQPPWSGARCPACGDADVKTFPRGYLARHPEVRAALRAAPHAAPAEPEPAADEPVASLAMAPPERPSSLARLRTSTMAYAVIALSALLFASLELYEILRTTHRVH
ncbi:hypothetical protein [Sphaerisporangium fuscum]|uniref:hypothetical protein n=1 Tax=Sphaerisporangium fuscum TaxID=2835868 RepID=UPI001BDBDF4D|nr:hypothetical protein [Sphaerisporangium fuscum]